MDISDILERNTLFSFVQVRQLFEECLHHFSQDMPGKAELVTNLCRLSAAEIVLLQRAILPYPIVRPMEILPPHGLSAIAKTDTSVFWPCRLAEVLPSVENVRVADFVLFTGDADKIREYWSSYRHHLVENDPYTDMLNGLRTRYQQSRLASAIRPLDIAASGILPWQTLVWRIKLDLCIGSSDATIEQHLSHSMTFF